MRALNTNTSNHDDKEAVKETLNDQTIKSTVIINHMSNYQVFISYINPGQIYTYSCQLSSDQRLCKGHNMSTCICQHYLGEFK